MRFNGGQVALAAAALGLGVVGKRFLQRLKAIDLSGKVVLITGSSRGLGLALAEEFTRREPGWYCALAMSRNWNGRGERLWPWERKY